ncbi:MAG: hypothetical protein WB801_10400 [Candidatus Dormiibacterota bacterium]
MPQSPDNLAEIGVALALIEVQGERLPEASLRLTGGQARAKPYHGGSGCWLVWKAILSDSQK